MTAVATGVESDLMRAILADPFDDGPRLVYADEIEPHEPERAEFIRVQIELSKQPWNRRINDPRYSQGEPWDTLKRRDAELFRDNDWDELPNGVGISLTYTRGFPSAVSLTFRQFMGGECEMCVGRSAALAFVDPGPCPKCGSDHGDIGRIPSLCESIAARWPVTEIRLTDREPLEFQSRGQYGWRWFSERYVTNATGNPQGIANEIYDMLPTCTDSFGHCEREAFYPTRSYAIAALSQAAVDYSRERAGLPPIKRNHTARTTSAARPASDAVRVY